MYVHACGQFRITNQAVCGLWVEAGKKTVLKEPPFNDNKETGECSREREHTAEGHKPGVEHAIAAGRLWPLYTGHLLKQVRYLPACLYKAFHQNYFAMMVNQEMPLNCIEILVSCLSSYPRSVFRAVHVYWVVKWSFIASCCVKSQI